MTVVNPYKRKKLSSVSSSGIGQQVTRNIVGSMQPAVLQNRQAQGAATKNIINTATDSRSTLTRNEISIDHSNKSLISSHFTPSIKKSQSADDVQQQIKSRPKSFKNQLRKEINQLKRQKQKRVRERQLEKDRHQKQLQAEERRREIERKRQKMQINEAQKLKQDLEQRMIVQKDKIRIKREKKLAKEEESMHMMNNNVTSTKSERFSNGITENISPNEPNAIIVQQLYHHKQQQYLYPKELQPFNNGSLPMLYLYPSQMNSYPYCSTSLTTASPYHIIPSSWDNIQNCTPTNHHSFHHTSVLGREPSLPQATCDGNSKLLHENPFQESSPFVRSHTMIPYTIIIYQREIDTSFGIQLRYETRGTLVDVKEQDIKNESDAVTPKRPCTDDVKSHASTKKK